MLIITNLPAKKQALLDIKYKSRICYIQKPPGYLEFQDIPAVLADSRRIIQCLQADTALHIIIYHIICSVFFRFKINGD